jgi:hypothetical protein
MDPAISKANSAASMLAREAFYIDVSSRPSNVRKLVIHEPA